MAQIWSIFALNVNGVGTIGPAAAAYIPIIRYRAQMALARVGLSASANYRWLLLCFATLAGLFLVPHPGMVASLMMLAIFVASLLSSIAGFAFSAICGAMLFHIPTDPIHLVQVMMTCSIANQATMTWAVRRDIDWKTLRTCLVGGAIGLPAGVWLLLHADRTSYNVELGVLLLAYSLYMLFRKPIVISNPPATIDFAMALLGGVTGGAAGFPAGFLAIWCGMKGWNKMHQRGVCQPFILTMQVAALAMIGLWHSGGTAVGFDFANLLYIPPGLLGTSIGMALYQRLSDVHFARGVNLLLLASGLSLVL